MTYTDKKIMAMQLRKQGYSYSLIAEQLGVSKGTLSVWLSKLPYTPNLKVLDRVGKARALVNKKRSEAKMATHERAQQAAIKDLATIKKRDIAMIGLGLYIGEGQKNETVGVINSDPRVIKLAIRWLCEAFGLTIENFTLAIHIYPDNNMQVSLNYWSKVTGIPISQFGKTQVDRRKDKSISKRGKLMHGTAHLRVKSNGNKEFGVFLSRRIRALMDLVLSENNSNKRA